MKNNIDKYLNDIGLNFTKYKPIPNQKVIEQYDFKGEDIYGEQVTGSILRSFNEITINYITQSGIRHLFLCKIKNSSINNYISNNTHSIINIDNEVKVIEIKSGENIPIEELFNFKYQDKHKQKIFS